MHERQLDGMPAGTYKLSAFVRDRSINVFGASEFSLTVPKPAARGIVGPIAVTPPATHLKTTLPSLSGKSARRSKESVAAPAVGTIPLSGERLVPAEPVDLRSLACNGPAGHQDVVRFLVREGQALFRFDTPIGPAEGGCREVADRLDTAQLPPGKYEYHVRWIDAGIDDAVIELHFGD